MKLSYRIGLWKSDWEFECLLNSIRRWKSAIDEINLFVDHSHHGYYPLEDYKALAPLLEKRMNALREASVPSVGINVLCTIGHLDEGYDWLTLPPFQTMVGHDGDTSRSCMCIRAPEYLPYIREKYAILARTGPDFMWVDDDMRMQHHGVEYPCFCSNCMEGFNRRTGGSWRREDLVQALDSDADGSLRREFLNYNREALNTVLENIREAVHAVNPNIKLGLMTVGAAWNSYGMSDQPGMLKALGAEMVRPGGGCYTDERPGDILSKALHMSLQNSMAEDIPDNQYELEDFPDCAGKSTHAHLLEFASALMAGCNGIAVNTVLTPYVPADLMDAFAQTRPMWGEMVEAMKGMRLRGYWPAFAPDCDAAPNIRHSIFSGGAGSVYGNETTLTTAGLAWTPCAADAPVTVVSGDMMAAIPEDQIPALFSRGVLMDAEALAHLIARGHGDLAGCGLGKAHHSGLVERYTDHPINGSAAGIMRNVYMNFWDRDGVVVHELVPAEGAAALSNFESITGVKCGPASTVFENRLGGRVAVLGYFPWIFLNVPGKRDSLPALMDWLANGRYPILIQGSRRVTPMLRTGEDGGFVAWLVNASFDRTKALAVRIDAACSGLKAYDLYGHPVEIPAEAVRTENGFTYVDLPNIDGWGALLLIGKK